MNRSRSLTLLIALILVCLAPQNASAAYGDLDADFGVGGKVRGLGITGSSEIQIQPDRKILVAGRTTTELSTYSGRIVRVQRNGELDSSFGAGGYVGMPGGGFLFDMDLLDDGRIAALVSDNKIVVLRADGSLDTGFGAGGVLSFGDAPTSLKAASITPQPGSKILVSGGIGTKTHNLAAQVIRLDKAGTLDLSFGDSGVAMLPGAISPGPALSSLATTPDGDVLVGVGRLTSSTEAYKRAVMKLTASGDRVANFGQDGFASDLGIPNRFGIGAMSSSEIVVSRDGGFVEIGKTVLNSGGRGGVSKHYWSSFFGADGELRFGYPSGWTADGATAVDGPGFAVAAANGVSVFKSDLTLNAAFARRGSNAVAVEDCAFWGELATDVDGSIVAASSCEFSAGHMVRFLGPSGGRAAPQANIKGLTYSRKFRGKRTRASWPRVLGGTAGPMVGIKRVSVAVRRIDGQRPFKKRCGWMVRSATRYSRRADCSKPVFMPAKGVRKWRFDFGRPLAAGKYELFVRATMVGGRVNPVNRDADSFRRFTVKPARK